MLGIKVQNEYLELQPGTRMELELNNPFLQFDGNMVGDFSMPLTVNSTPKNLRLLKFAGLLQQRVDLTGIDAAAYDNDLQHSVGKLKIDQPTHNLLGSNRGQMSMYYLTGVANFYQDIKYLALGKIDLGGDRSFPWRSNADGSWISDSGDGFWAHIHTVINSAPASFDYAFYPVINKQFTGMNDQGDQIETQCMNWQDYVNGQSVFRHRTTDGKELNVVVPFPYLSYVLKKAVAAAGWNIDGPIFDDPDFKKITMVNFNAIYYGFFSPAEHWSYNNPALPVVGVHPENVVFNLQDCMPAISVSDFLLALKNRFGWWFDFDRRSKTIHIRELKQVVLNSKLKDFTRQASTVITKKVDQTLKYFSLKNEFVGDYAGGAPQLTSLDVYFQGWVNNKTDLTAATADKYGWVYGVRAENSFYMCRIDASDTTSDTYKWDFYAYNIYDVIPVLTDIPPGYQVGQVQVPVVPVLQTPQQQVTDITTKATTLGNEQFTIPPGGVQTGAVGSPDPLLDYIPRMDFPGNWDTFNQSNDSWSIHLLMFHGLQPNKQGHLIPFASAGVYNIQGTQVAQWSLAFQAQLFDGSQVGLYDRQWKPVLDTLKSPETMQFTLKLTRAEFMQLQFSDTIVIAGVKMYLTKIKANIPFTGTLDVEAIRV